jgi:hypothetical protein
MKEYLLKARAYIDYIELVDFVKSKDWTLSSLFAVLNGHNLDAINHLFDCNYKSICATIREGMFGCYVDLTIEVWDDKHIDTIGLFNAKDLAKYVSIDTVDKQKMVCGHCKEEFDQDPDDTVYYNGKPICDYCFQNLYGYCEVCQEVHPYDEMLVDYYGNYCAKCIDTLLTINEKLKEEIGQLKGEK